MKKYYALLLVNAGCYLGGCKKTKDTDCDRIPARIIKYECDRVIFQVLTSDQVGDQDWANPQTGEHFSNVVSYYNSCAISEITKGSMDTLYVQLRPEDDKPAALNCNQCLALPVNPPQTKVSMSDISTTACESTGFDNQ